MDFSFYERERKGRRKDQKNLSSAVYCNWFGGYGRAALGGYSAESWVSWGVFSVSLGQLLAGLLGPCAAVPGSLATEV